MRDQPTQLNGRYDEISNWDSPTGASLCVYYRKAQIMTTGKAKGVIHINHGLADHAGRYARFAAELTAAGFHVYAQDHRGHGATTSPTSKQGVFADKDGWDKALKDMHFVNREIHKKHPELPVIIFGHSMGAMLGYNYLLRWPDTIDAAAIWNAAITKTVELTVLSFILRLEKLFKDPQAKSIMSKLTFEGFNKKFKPNETNADWLSKDVGECKTYDADPDCGWDASVSMWRDLASGIKTGASDSGLENVSKSMPIYLLGGAADPSVSLGKAVLALEARLIAADFTNIKTVIRENGRHEALNEPEDERNAVMQGFIDWAQQSVEA